MTTQRTSRRRPGFTLIEVLAVVTIILILAGGIAAVVGGAQKRAANARAKAEIAAISLALDQYKQDTGAYPVSTLARNNATNGVVLFTALNSLGGGKPYLELKPDQLIVLGSQSVIRDPFGYVLNYYCDSANLGSQTNKVTFDLWSWGPDGVESADDVTNWR